MRFKSGIRGIVVLLIGLTVRLVCLPDTYLPQQPSIRNTPYFADLSKLLRDILSFHVISNSNFKQRRRTSYGGAVKVGRLSR